jgi:hypothetical protein
VILLIWAVARLVVVLRGLAGVVGVIAVVLVVIMIVVVGLVVVSVEILVVIVLWGEPQLQQKGAASWQW